METSDKKKMMPSEEKVWQKYYPPSAKELLEKKMPEQTLWQYVSEAIWTQGDKYDAFVYFGRHIKRSTFLAEVEKWARVLRGMGLGVGDQVLLFSPAVPEAFYVLFAADCIGVTTIMPNMASSPEALKKYYARAKVAFVFDGMADLLNDILAKPQFKCVVLINATRSMSVPLKITVGLVNWVKTCKVRHSRSKYLTMSQALRRFGGYAGPIEAPYEKERMAMVFSSGGTTKTGEAKLVCMTDKAMVEMFRGMDILNLHMNPLAPGRTSFCQAPPFVCTGFFVLVLVPLVFGMTVYLEPRLSQKLFNSYVKKIRPSAVLTGGPMWTGFFRDVEQRIEAGEEVDLSHFVLPFMGGEGCTPEKLAWMNKLLRYCKSPTGIVSGYGQSEVFSVITVDYRPGMDEKKNKKLVNSVGIPYPGLTVGIFDENGQELGYGQRGELWVKTPTHMAGYLDDGHLMRYSTDDGWVHTGDLCEMDEDGVVYFYGRMGKHVVAPDGTRVYLFDIANRLRQDRDVKESLVVAINNDTKNNPQVVAHLVLKEDAKMDYELVKRLDDDIASMLPEGVEVKGYKQQKEFRISLICKTDIFSYGTEYDGYWKPVDGTLKAVSF